MGVERLMRHYESYGHVSNFTKSLRDTMERDAEYLQQQRNEANDMFHRIANEVADTVTQKNHDYGNSYFRLRDEWGVQSFGVRIGDKYHRLVNLLKGGEAQINESIEDTIRDMIGYCLLELAYRRRNIDEDDRSGGGK